MKRINFFCKLNLPYWNRYRVANWTPLHLEFRKGFALDYEYGWYAVHFAFLFLKIFFEWRVPIKVAEEEEE